MATAITVGELPTAQEDPESWNVLWIAGLPVPGVCLPIDAEMKRSVDHKKGKGSSKDTLVDNGMDLSEGEVTIRTTDSSTFRDLYDFYLKYMAPDRAHTRRNVVPISHPQLYSRGIKQVYFYAAPVPKPTSDTGIRPYLHKFRFKIIGPKTQISSGSGSAKPKQSGLVAGPTDPNFKAKGKPVGLMSTSPALLPGVSSGTKPQPPAQPAVAMTPAEQGKLAGAGDPTAKFTMGITQGAAP